jgi:hypothetical protein
MKDQVSSNSVARAMLLDASYEASIRLIFNNLE